VAIVRIITGLRSTISDQEFHRLELGLYPRETDPEFAETTGISNPAFQ
jgi:hypothetical protein